MAEYRLIVFTAPVPGREDDYNHWYTDQHLKDVVAIPGFRSAQRFQLKTSRAGSFKHSYLAIYEIDSDDPDRVLCELTRRIGTSAMIISDALDRSLNQVGLFEACSPLVTLPWGDEA